MAIRSLTDIWIDANFKETQLRDLRIGQPVDLDVDMYGDRHFQGPRLRLHDGNRIDAGAAAGAERDRQLRQGRAAAAGANRCRATTIPTQLPLFIGLSVAPYVYINEPPTGPNAGKFLQALFAWDAEFGV